MPAAPAAPVAPPAPAVQAPAQAYYASCADAKAAGVAPIYSGQPGYRAGLDRDNDGTACDK
ncbi:Excalibur calcium-binding domain protein [compost metagenome]